jgi:mannan endo-1,4-beta-mannosidase
MSERRRRAAERPRSAARRPVRLSVAIGAVVVAAAVVLAFALHAQRAAAPRRPPLLAGRATPAPRARSYLGLYRPGVPGSYQAVSAFTAASGVRPDLVVYYSGWMEQFQAAFAAKVASHHAVPLVQIDPSHVSLAAIAAGHYDSYLAQYAAEVRAYHRPVILSFGHEMNGYWYYWGHGHTSPAVFVAAWRHIVTVFRQYGARNVTWMWTVNVIEPHQGIPSPTPWWPGRAYVNWVGIDGYFLRSSWTFAPLFGPTINAVRALSRVPVPILISETAAAPAAGQPAKIADLFAGIRDYGLLGFVWFDADRDRDWRLRSPAAFGAYHRGASAFDLPRS